MFASEHCEAKLWMVVCVMYVSALLKNFLALFSYISMMNLDGYVKYIAPHSIIYLGKKYMTIEIIPAGSSAVVTERHGHDRHDRDDIGDRYRNHDRFAEVRRDVAEEGAKNTVATKDGKYESVLATTVTGSAGVLATKESRFDVMQGLTNGFTAQALAACHSDEENKEDFFNVQKQISDSAYATQGGFKDLTALSYQVEGRSLLEAAKNAAALAVQADKNWAATNLQAQVNYAASTLLATQIAAQAAKEAAECCCELKEKIGDEGQKTRDLINAIQTQDLRDRASKAESALAAYFAAKVCPVVP